VIRKYRVVFLDLLESEDDFRERMGRLGVPPAIVDQIIRKAPVILKGGMILKDARQYADAIQDAGGRVSIQEHGLSEEPEQINKSFRIKPLEHFTMCPECGFKQLKGQSCVKCGSSL
jgi:hypothetical protein